MRGRTEGGGGLIEAYVAVGSQTENLNVDPAGSRDRAFVSPAFPLDVAGTAVEKVCSAPGDVDVIEQMRAHEPAVAGRILTAQPEEFVEIEGRHAREVDAVCRVRPDQVVVKQRGGPAGGKPQNGIRLRSNRTRDILR
jgi:hypothetical protein